MCGRRRQRGYYLGAFGTPGYGQGCHSHSTCTSTACSPTRGCHAAGPCTHQAYAHSFGGATMRRGGCGAARQRPQTLTGLAINAIATAIEKKNQERNERTAALTRGAAQQSSGVVGPSNHSRYAQTELDGMVRQLSLNGTDDEDEEKDKDKDHVAGPPPVAAGEAPPAYTETAQAERALPSHPAATASRQMTRAAATPPPPPKTSLHLHSPLLATHAAHPIIVTDLQNLEAALVRYRGSRCGGAVGVKRARKQLVSDLGVLEAERLRAAGCGRRDVKKAARDVWREGKELRWEVRGLMRG